MLATKLLQCILWIKYTVVNPKMDIFPWWLWFLKALMQVHLSWKFHGNSLSCWIYISRLVAVYKTLQWFYCLLYTHGQYWSMLHPSQSSSRVLRERCWVFLHAPSNGSSSAIFPFAETLCTVSVGCAASCWENCCDWLLTSVVRFVLFHCRPVRICCRRSMSIVDAYWTSGLESDVGVAKSEGGVMSGDDPLFLISPLLPLFSPSSLPCLHFPVPISISGSSPIFPSTLFSLHS